MNMIKTLESPKMKKSNSTMSLDSNITRPNSLGNSSRHLDNFGKKRSRVSLLLGQMESNSIKEYEELIKEDYEEENPIPYYNMDIPISFVKDLPKPISIKINIFIEMGKTERIFTQSLQMKKESTIRELIALTVDQFNQGNYQIDLLNETKTTTYELRFQTENYNLYSIHSSKKNSKPKLDMPQFASKTTLNNTFTNNFSFVFNKESLLMRKIGNIIEDKKELRKRKGGCIGCIIM